MRRAGWWALWSVSQQMRRARSALPSLYRSQYLEITPLPAALRWPGSRPRSGIRRHSSIRRSRSGLDSRLAPIGRKLFFDPRLSATGTTACASCHDPRYAFAQPRRVATSDDGRPGRRNAPSLLDVRFLPDADVGRQLLRARAAGLRSVPARGDGHRRRRGRASGEHGPAIRRSVPAGSAIAGRQRMAWRARWLRSSAT